MNPNNKDDEDWKQIIKQSIAKRQQLDQTLATVADMFPPLWKRIYDNCLKEGFNEGDSMQLLKAYIIGCSGGGKI